MVKRYDDDDHDEVIGSRLLLLAAALMSARAPPPQTNSRRMKKRRCTGRKYSQRCGAKILAMLRRVEPDGYGDSYDFQPINSKLSRVGRGVRCNVLFFFVLFPLNLTS